MCVCVSQNTRDSSSGCFQSCRLMKSMNVFKKEKKRSCPLSSSKSRPKNGKKAFSCESTAHLASSDKSSFYSQDEWLQKIEEHECKPNTSEKQSVEMSASRSKIRLEEAEEEQDVGSWTVSEFTNLLFASSPMSAGAGLLAAGLNHFLVFGIVISLAIIKDVFIAACNLNYL